MDCPRDNTEMSELTDGEERVLFRCAECGGLWLDVADLNRILLHAGLPTLEAMGGRANPESDAGECPVDNVALLAVESAHKRNPLVYETCESCGGIWLGSAPQPLALRVELSPIDAALEVYDRDRNRIARVHEERVIPAVACVEACFVKVSGSAPGPYTLTVLGAPPQPGRELEPNDRAVD